MKIAVIGSRSIAYDRMQETVFAYLERYIPVNATEIVSGGAVGADKLAERYADLHHLRKTVFLPDYETHGRRAPLVRNEQIVKAADYVLAFWDGKSRGTAHTVSFAVTEGVPVKIIRL
ncbi:MAG: DUF2493 domain-containing protein [Ruminococcus sp.]|nr:DUF2493 domain-containing protein [Candidatus Apopatosoma intestinale]